MRFSNWRFYLFVVKRNFWRLIFTLFLAADIAAGVVLWRSPDPRYRAREWLALGRYHAHDALISEVAGKAEVDALLVKAVVWRETRFQKTMVGTAGERGLMQVGENAARDWAAAQHIESFMFTDLFDARTNLQAGTWYLARALEHWKDRDDPLPFALASLQAAVLQLLPNPILTMDQVKLLKKDNVVAPTAAGLADLGITPTSVEAVIPSYLWRFRAKGEYAADVQNITGLSQP